VAEALRSLNYKVIAIGDSYNDITMLKAASMASCIGRRTMCRTSFRHSL